MASENSVWHLIRAARENRSMTNIGYRSESTVLIVAGIIILSLTVV